MTFFWERRNFSWEKKFPPREKMIIPWEKKILPWEKMIFSREKKFPPLDKTIFPWEKMNFSWEKKFPPLKKILYFLVGRKSMLLNRIVLMPVCCHWLTGLPLTKIIPNFAGNQLKKMYVSLFSTNFRECHCFCHGSNHQIDDSGNCEKIP